MLSALLTAALDGVVLAKPVQTDGDIEGTDPGVYDCGPELSPKSAFCPSAIVFIPPVSPHLWPRAKRAFESPLDAIPIANDVR